MARPDRSLWSGRTSSQTMSVDTSVPSLKGWFAEKLAPAGRALCRQTRRRLVLTGTDVL